ncbi:MAG: tRNA uridine-5-carboxymethylaminomethyl(34) synthesis GTPase MnmE [Spirochaetales bacterium]|jgi:tRNA modification GTPase|nr:tRNA uridine-5-carboxymethylaminomethyl(34) synthesis GTPase MnmE [Spirochaetales bacterium]
MNKNFSAYNTEDCIAALATPWGQSALAVIRASGKDCVNRFAPAFSKAEKLIRARGGSMVHGSITDPHSGGTLDEVLVGVFRQPQSYTGEEAFEIYCHGSLPGIRGILALLARLGFRQAQPGEFSFRAFFNGKMDLTRAEAVQEIVCARTEKAHALALRRLSGAIAEKISQARNLLVQALAGLEIRLDYPEEDVPDSAAGDGAAAPELPRAEEILKQLLATCAEGRLYQEGARVALAGKVNAGKSSLFNYIVREERSIVSENPGTTRDYIEALVPVAGIPVTFYDTAGLRDSSDSVETEGVRRSRLILEHADLVIYLIDASEEDAFQPDRKDTAATGETGGRRITVWNKIDRLPPQAADQARQEGRICVSATGGDGIPELLEEIAKELLPARSAGEEALIDSLRQKELLEQSLEALRRFSRRAGIYPLDIVAEDLREAVNALGKITGEVTTEEMLSLMFSRFCVGK